jgi:hypothetical protein
MFKYAACPPKHETNFRRTRNLFLYQRTPVLRNCRQGTDHKPARRIKSRHEALMSLVAPNALHIHGGEHAAPEHPQHRH